MFSFDNLVNLAQSFLQQATPDPTQWNDAAAHTFYGELHSINAELQALQRIVLAIDVAEVIVGV